jgi:hypothetical protein
MVLTRKFQPGPSYNNHIYTVADLDRRFLKPGDVILIRKRGISYQSVGQTVSKVGSLFTTTGLEGDTQVTHGAIIGTRNGETGALNYIEPNGSGTNNMTGQSMLKLWARHDEQRDQHDQVTDAGVRTVILFYRCVFQDLAEAAAEVAYQWSTRDEGREGRQHTVKARFGRMLRGTLAEAGSWDDTALMRAIKYAAMGAADKPNLNKGTMCSTFVVAAYQAGGLRDVVDALDANQRLALKRWEGPQLLGVGVGDVVPQPQARFREQEATAQWNLGRAADVQQSNQLFDQAELSWQFFSETNASIQHRISRVMAADAKGLNPAKLHARLVMDAKPEGAHQWYPVGYILKPEALNTATEYLGDEEVQQLLDANVLTEGSRLDKRDQSAFRDDINNWFGAFFANLPDDRERAPWLDVLKMQHKWNRHQEEQQLLYDRGRAAALKVPL